MSLKKSLRRTARQVLPRPILRHALKRRLAQQIAQSGEPELLHVGKLVRPGDLCLDIGSNIGLYSFELSRKGCRVVAFEPNPTVARTVRLLEPAVEVRQVALSSAEGSARLTVPIDDHGLATLRSDASLDGRLAEVTVETRRVDNLGFENVAFIKIDVEGFEEQVLDGAAATIARDMPPLLIEIEERHNEGGLSRIRDRLGALGYQTYFLDGSRWRSAEEFDPAVDQSLAAVEALQAGATQRTVRYINNFLFLPPKRAIAELG